jgi:hypothetical protein
MSSNPPTWSRAFIPDAEFVDDSYSERELERLDGNELQSLAAKHPTDEVNGRSKAENIRKALVGKARVE